MALKMASSRLGIEMNSFLNDLQVREKKLLLGALVLIFLFVVFVYINSVYDEYLISKKNLSKAKVIMNMYTRGYQH